MDDPRKPEGFTAQKLLVLPEYIQKELTEEELTQGLFVSDIGMFPHARYHFRERPEGSAASIFIYCVEGEGWIELLEDGGLPDKTYLLKERQLAVIPAGCPHKYGASATAPWSIYWFHLQGDLAVRLIRTYGLDAGEPFSLPLSVHLQLMEQFDQCYSLLADKPYSLPVQIHVSQAMRHLLSSIGLAAERSAANQRQENYLDEAIRYMAKRVADSVTLPDIAKHTGLSKQHLIYLFNREIGCPPIEYFLRLKMQRAGQLLDLSDLSVKEIAAAVGIADPYYFSRLFKKTMGYSPTAYRKIPKG